MWGSSAKRSINEQRREVKELRKSEERFRSLVELAPDGIITTTPSGKITSINAAYTNLTGDTKEDVVGKHFTQLRSLQVGVRDFPKYAKFFSLVVLGRNPPPFEFPYTHKDGSKKWASAQFKMIRSTGTSSEVIGILRDVTDRKQDEERINNLLKELEASNRELEHSNRELEDFTYAVSHDLKAPLRTVEAFAGFLIDDYAKNLDETGNEYLNRMKNASIRMTGLIDDLLNLSRVGRMHADIVLVDLNELVEEIKLDFETQINERNAEIISSRLPAIKTQYMWVQQLFSNLISNGLKFNTSKTPKVWIRHKDQKDYHLFSVKDNGIGIEKRYQEKIFKIFHRLHSREEYPGSGTGLTICKKIVETFGGRIWVESKPGAGSTFYFTIPKEEIVETEVSEYSHEVDQGVIQVQEELTEHAE